ncbi:hypothetical protein BJ742DRAFT_767334 [Cladochytrium replicatum]|nr:hypothetical protein BJ742DRAFT_767334 [Cladochytrium replicatum]
MFLALVTNFARTASRATPHVTTLFRRWPTLNNTLPSAPLQQIAQKHVPARDSSNKKLPGYLLPKQKARTEILKTMLKYKNLYRRLGEILQDENREDWAETQATTIWKGR